MTAEQKYHILLNKIDAVRKKKKLIRVASGALFFVVILLASVITVQLLEMIFHFSTKVRLLIDIVFISTLILSVVFYLIRPIASLLLFKNSPSTEKIASQIGHHFPDIGDRLLNALQVFRMKGKTALGISAELATLSVDKIFEQTKETDFTETVSWQPLFRKLNFVSAGALLFILLQIVFQAPFSAATNRLFHPFTQFESGQKITFEIEPGNKQVIKNASVTVVATVSGEPLDEIFLHLEGIHGTFHNSHPLVAKGENLFSYTIAHIQDTTIYYFSAGEQESPRFQLDVVELPLVRQLQVTVLPPRYAGMKETFLEENVGDFSCLKGSYVTLNLTANKILEKAKVIFNDKKMPLSISGNRARGGFRVKEAGTYFIRLRDVQGIENRNPIQYRISIIEDVFPQIAIIVPGQDVDLSEDLILPLKIEAEDDFGFTSLRLGYRIFRADVPYQDTTLKFLPLKYEVYQNTKLAADHLWELSSLDLFPGDVVRYFAEVFDNDNVSGPKSTRSMAYSARFPTLEEIYAAVNSKQEETYESVEGLYEKSKELKEDIDKLVQELKKNPEMKWEEKQQVDDILKNQKNVEKSLEEVQQQLDQLLERMEKNDLISLETLKKYAELQQLLNEILTEDLKEAFKKLQQAAEKMDPELIKQAMEQLNFSQEEFLKNIEKTLEILKRIQIEQKMDEVVRKIEQLMNEQQKVSDQLDKKMNQDALDKLAQDQQEIENDASKTMDEIQKLADAMKEFPDMPDEALEALLDQAKREGLLEHMNQAASQMQSGKQNQAQAQSQMAMNALSNMLCNMNQAKQNMLEKQKREIMRELRRLTHNFVSLSKRQEALANKTEKISPNSPLSNKLADEQQNILNAVSRNADRMAGLSQKTFFVSPQMARAVGQAMQRMAQALSQFEARNLSQSSREQQQAMRSLNEAAKQMMDAMNELASAQSATGLEEMLQKLAQMSGKQQGINQQTLQLGQGQQPFSLSQQAQMARLAAEQQALRKTLEQLQREFGERSDILGRLDGIGKQMEEVVKDLQTRRVGRQTIQRQQKILQRLLDAQKSARRQDFSRKRRAETGKFYPAVNPGNLPKNLGEKMQAIQKDLLRALKEGYAKDYQQLIKKYFEALIKKNATDEEANINNN